MTLPQKELLLVLVALLLGMVAPVAAMSTGAIDGKHHLAKRNCPPVN
jgi:hypothetical protein